MSKKIKIEDLINELNIILKKKYSDFRGIYFFGSRLKGQYSSESDYDMVFVFNKKIDWYFRKEIIKIVYDIELQYDIFIDVKVYNINDILEPVTPFRRAILNDGIFYAS